MKPWLAWAFGVALLAAAWLVALITPPEDATLEPFPITAEVGERVVSRTIVATVTDPRIAERVEDRGWYAEGTWLVVDVELESAQEEAGSGVYSATLQIGDRIFRASERPRTIAEWPLTVGIPQRGSLAFELPAEALSAEGAGDAVLRLAQNSDARLDDVVEAPLDLSAIDTVASTELTPTGWSER